MTKVDLVVIGAGPAGMSAARIAAEAGLSVAVVDEQRQAGGQIYRNVARAPHARRKILGHDFGKGKKLVDDLTHPKILHVPGATVWQIEDRTRVAYTANNVAALITGERLLLATGALERPMPIPGWTLPGVMNVGAAQILIKDSGMVLENAVLTGSGPLLYLVAVQMCRAGFPPLALVETQTLADLFSSLRHGMGALRGWRYLAKGLSLLAELKKAGVKRYSGASAISVDGTERAEAIRFNVGKHNYTLPCEIVLLHNGVVPNTQTARSININHEWNNQQRAFVAVTNEWGRTLQSEIFIAGDSAGIGGADAAAVEGELSALEIACDLGAITQTRRDEAAKPLRHRLRNELAARPFIDRAYPPYSSALTPTDATIVCRCEEVTAGEIRKIAKTGGIGPNEAKAFGRQGMGPCQGRFCGLTVTELLAAETGRSPESTGYYRIRPPIKPVTLRELANMAATGDQDDGKPEHY